MGVSALIPAQARGFDQAAAVIGVTPEEIHANMPHIVERHLGVMPVEHLRGLSDQELVELATRAPSTFTVIANREPHVYGRMVRATWTAALKHSRGQMMPAVYYGGGQFIRTAGIPFIPSSTGIWNTLTEIYLDFRTAPIGGLGPAPAVIETLGYAGPLLYGSWKLGYSYVGPYINQLMQTYTPSLYDNVGGTIDQYLSNWPLYINNITQSDAIESGIVNNGDTGSATPGSTYDTTFNGGSAFGDFGLFDDIQSQVGGSYGDMGGGGVPCPNCRVQ